MSLSSRFHEFFFPFSFVKFPAFFSSSVYLDLSMHFHFKEFVFPFSWVYPHFYESIFQLVWVHVSVFMNLFSHFDGAYSSYLYEFIAPFSFDVLFSWGHFLVFTKLLSISLWIYLPVFMESSLLFKSLSFRCHEFIFPLHKRIFSFFRVGPFSWVHL